MSADPYIQAPDNLQSYNRYSYVLNNPLNMTDPSGYFSLGKAFRVGVAIAVAVFAPEISAHLGWTQGVVAGHAVVGTGLAASFGITSSAVASGVLGGALSGAILTGSFKGAVVGGLTGGAFGYVGDKWAGWANVGGHAAVGCVSSVANGGACGSGALSGAAGSLYSNFGPKFESMSARLVAHRIVGGTASVLGGGKFDNGAATAAMGYLFNDLAHWRQAEMAQANAMRAAGYQVIEQVALTVTDAAGKQFTVIADAIGIKGDKLLISEVKTGLSAKLSPNQRAMFEVALSKGEIAIQSAERAGALGLRAGQSLFSQGSTLAQVAIQLEAATGSRAAGQLLRSAAGQGAIGGVVRFLGSGAALVITEGLLHTGGLN